MQNNFRLLIIFYCLCNGFTPVTTKQTWELSAIEEATPEYWNALYAVCLHSYASLRVSLVYAIKIKAPHTDNMIYQTIVIIDN